MRTPGPLQKLEMPPLKNHMKQSMISIFRDANAGVIGQFFQCSIEVVGVSLRSEGDFMQDIQKFKRSAGLDVDLGCWI